MKLFNVVLGENDKYNNDWAITKDQYDNDVVINESTSQRIKVGKYLVPTLSLVSDTSVTTDASTDLVTTYHFSDDGHYVVNKKNLSIIMIKNGKNDKRDYSTQHLIYLTIPTERLRVVDSIINLDCADIINSYRNNGMIGAVISIDTALFPSEPLTSSDENLCYEFNKKEVSIGEFILYDTAAEDESRRVIKKIITVDRDLSRLSITSFFIPQGFYKDLANNVAESNFFKKLIISPTKTPRTSVYIVSDKVDDKVSEIFTDDDDVTILSVNPKIFKNCDDQGLINTFDECVKTHIVANKVRAITVVGVKLPKEFYNKYRITTCFVHDLESGIIRCIKC